jgi:hypothetical protein
MQCHSILSFKWNLIFTKSIIFPSLIVCNNVKLKFIMWCYNNNFCFIHWHTHSIWAIFQFKKTMGLVPFFVLIAPLHLWCKSIVWTKNILGMWINNGEHELHFGIGIGKTCYHLTKCCLSYEGQWVPKWNGPIVGTSKTRLLLNSSCFVFLVAFYFFFVLLLVVLRQCYFIFCLVLL